MFKEIKSYNKENIMTPFNSNRDNKIMILTKVNEIRHILATTDKGELSVGLSKGQ